MQSRIDAYAGKPFAALDREYLRDLFDVMLLQQTAGIQRALVDVFLGYLLSGARRSPLGKCG
jgi:hypothetical protein